MKNYDLSFLLSLDLKNKASVIDESLVMQLDSAIKKLVQLRRQVREIKHQSGGSLPSEGLLVIGSSAFASLDVGSKSAIVYEIDVIRGRRKGK